MEVMVVNLEVLGVVLVKSQTDPLSCLLNTPVVGPAFQQEITSATLIFQTMTPSVKTVDTVRLLGIDARETLYSCRNSSTPEWDHQQLERGLGLPNHS